MRSAVEPDVASLLSAMHVDRRAFLGVIAKGSALALPGLERIFAATAAAKPLVVQVHHEDAVFWDYRTGWYGEHVDQSLVDAMLDRAILELTGIADVAAAWRSLLPGYVKGRKVAVKMNFNCCESCSDSDNYIDGLAEPANAAIRALTAAGVAEDDIWIYDAVRELPARFLRRLRGNVATFARSVGCGNRLATFSGSAPGSVIQFTKAGVPSQVVTDVVVQADYLINMPITKQHAYAGLTLSYKNHFGTIQRCSQMHPWTFLSGSGFSTSWSPLPEIMANPHIGGKTVLTIADCLYGDFQSQCGIPRPWQTFGGRSPACLLVATDAVALDCVQRDILIAERAADPRSEAYLKLAAQLGQGIYESTPASGGYQLIDHRRLELKGIGRFEHYGSGKPGTGGVAPSWRFTGVPSPGGSVVVEVTKGLPGGAALVVIGLRRAAIAIPFGTLLVDPILLAVSVSLDGAGEHRIPLTLPSSPGTLGAEFVLQALVLDPGATAGVAHTDGLQMRVGRSV